MFCLYDGTVVAPYSPICSPYLPSTKKELWNFLRVFVNPPIRSSALYIHGRRNLAAVMLIYSKSSWLAVSWFADVRRHGQLLIGLHRGIYHECNVDNLFVTTEFYVP